MTNGHGRAGDALSSGTVLSNSRWPVPLANPLGLRCQRLCEQLELHINIWYHGHLEAEYSGAVTLPLIIETSLAPSPIASVTAFLARLINSTTKAFCRGVTRQQITALHCEATSRNLNSVPKRKI